MLVCNIVLIQAYLLSIAAIFPTMGYLILIIVYKNILSGWNCQRGGGCPIPKDIWSQPGLGSEQLDLAVTCFFLLQEIWPRSLQLKWFYDYVKWSERVVKFCSTNNWPKIIGKTKQNKKGQMSWAGQKKRLNKTHLGLTICWELVWDRWVLRLSERLLRGGVCVKIKCKTGVTQ